MTTTQTGDDDRRYRPVPVLHPARTWVAITEYGNAASRQPSSSLGLGAAVRVGDAVLRCPPTGMAGEAERPRMHRITVGAVEIVSLYDEAFLFDPQRVWPDAGAGIEAYRNQLEPDGQLGMDCLCFLLRAEGQTVLVDTGLGPESNGQLMDELRAAGIAPEEVDQVVFTHLHGDHTGWNLDRQSGQPLFPRATYLVPKGDWDDQTTKSQPSASFTRDVAPLRLLDRMELIEDGYVLGPSFTAIHTPGHTPGHTSIAVTSNGEQALILGDVFLTPIDVQEPDWSSTFDSDMDVARTTRHAILDRLETSGELVAPAHVRSPGFGRIMRVEGRRVWRPVS
ncbi:MAG: MBL fold metallo-hydrolase [Dehalococcoidia bacterium]|nr:MBL fold metallo-hydrolase [Dehalococcoidia bacterium]